MSGELVVLRILQSAMFFNTLLIIIGIILVRRAQLEAHRKLMSFVLISTLLAALSLVVSLFFGFDYKSTTTPMRMLIHRAFSVPLFPLLIWVFWSGLQADRKKHLLAVVCMVPFWIGTLTTGLWFF
ncbi:MAG: DUF420 domain-containing protein [Planctomycetes bacterium]|nr:DUF420 domain-containing protein [Planctomycetota bacterium]